MVELKITEKRILRQLRTNSRQSLKEIAKKVKMPISTVADKLRNKVKNCLIHTTALVDFDRMGYVIRTYFIISIKLENQSKLSSYLIDHNKINNLFKINNGYNFMFEAIFKSLNEQEEFIQDLESNFEIKKMETFYILKDIKRESFFKEEKCKI